MSEGVDYSGGRPGGAALQAAGKTFAMRYVAHAVAGYNLTLDEVADLQGHGVAVGIVCERGKARALQGRPAGVIDGKAVLATTTQLGVPVDRPAYFAIDFDAAASQQPLIDAYLDGAASVLGAKRVGVYGSLGVVTRCRAAHSAAWFWQTYAWSGGQLVNFAHVYQYHNGQTINHAAVDLDRSMQADFGQWGLGSGSGETGDDMRFGNANGLGVTSNTRLPIVKGDRWTYVDGSPGGQFGEDIPEGLVVVSLIDSVAGSYLVQWRTGAPYPNDTVARDSTVRIDTKRPTIPAPDDATPYSQADLDTAKADAHAAGRESFRADVEAIP